MIRARQRPRPAGRRWTASCSLAALLLGGCEVESRGPARCEPIERLAFVPPGQAGWSSRIEAATSEALLVGQFEVTRGEWRAWYLARPEEADPDALARVAAWERATDDWPASFLSLLEARRYARDLGLRLPTAGEWLRIACGTSAAPFPWGLTDATSVANTLELDLRQPTPVGTFEQGRTPLGTYDMLGNVWEWVEAPLAGASNLQWAMGGSYLTLRQRLFDPRADEQGALHLALDERHRAIDLGLRLVVEARTWLTLHLPELERMSAADERLAAVGRRWGAAAIPLLEDLARAQPASAALRALLAGARS